MNNAFFIDRDGVINYPVIMNGMPFPPKNLLQLEIFPHVHYALTLLKNKGYLLIVVTNQPDVARGTISMASVEEINLYLKSNLPIDEIKTCYHDKFDGCNCRKPLPGSIISAAIKYDINLSTSFMIGDRKSDIEAGRRAGCKTIYIDYGYNEEKPLIYDFKVTSLLEAAHLI